MESIDRMIGAAPKWVTPCSRMDAKITSADMVRLQMNVPPMIPMVQMWPQPLQWNSGTVYR